MSDLNNNNENISLTVEALGGDSDATFSVKQKQITPLGKLMSSYAERTRIPVSMLRFCFYGARIRSDDTPQSHGMKDGDIIEVFITRPFPSKIIIKACENNDPVMLRSLIGHRPEDCINRGDGNKWPLGIAVEKNFTELVDILLAYPHTDVNFPKTEFNSSYIDDSISKDHGTALCVACRHGHKDIVKKLLNVPKIDVNACDEEVMTPVILATQRNYTEIVKIFSNVQATDWNHQTLRGDTAAILAAEGNYTGILKILMDIPSVNWNLKNAKGESALTAALNNFHSESAKMILSVPSLEFDTNHLWSQSVPRDMVTLCIESLKETSKEIDSNIKALMMTGNKVNRHMNSLLSSLGDGESSDSPVYLLAFLGKVLTSDNNGDK